MNISRYYDSITSRDLRGTTAIETTPSYVTYDILTLTDEKLCGFRNLEIVSFLKNDISVLVKNSGMCFCLLVIGLGMMMCMICVCNKLESTPRASPEKKKWQHGIIRKQSAENGDKRCYSN